MANISFNRRIWIALALATMVVASAAIASVIGGNKVLSPDLIAEIEEITGRRFVYGRAPIIRFFPTLSAEFQNVGLHDWKNASDNYPIVTVASLRVELSLYSALSGKVQLTGASLQRPVFHTKSFDGEWQFPFGPKAKLMKLVSDAGLNLAGLSVSETIDKARGLAFGSITINNGSIVLPQIPGTGSKTSVTELDAQILWPAPGKASSLVALGNWNGQKAQLNFHTSDLVLLLAGADTKVSANLVSSFATSQFSGTARLMPSPFFEGRLFAETGSPLDVSSWQKISPPLDKSAPKLTVKGQLRAETGKWQLEDGKFLFGNNSGSGALSFMPLASPPALSGTMDFDVLDLAMLKPLLFADSKDGSQSGSSAMAVDLRVSAKTAAFGTLALNKVAASIQVSAESRTIDINQASVFGGNLQLSLKNINKSLSADPLQHSEIRILAADIDTKQLAGLGLIADQLPEARGAVSAIIRGPLGETINFFRNAEGTIKLRLTEGNMPGAESSALIEALQHGGFVSLESNSSKKLNFSELSAEASLGNGNLRISALRIGLLDAALDLSGAYAFKEDSFALTGSMLIGSDPAQEGSTNKNIRVFVGGSRKAPIISALPSQSPNANP